MLGLLLIYWVGKTFHDLAEKHGRSKGLYALIGIVSYYAAQIIFGFVLGIIWYATNDSDPDFGMGINILGVAVGALSCWGLYEFLKYRWSNAYQENQAQRSLQDSDLLDDDLIFAE